MTSDEPGDTNMERRMNIELHSLSRYPPMGLDDEACDALQRQDLVTAIVSRGPYKSARYVLTKAGRERRNSTTDGCTVEHCPCRGGVESDDIARSIESLLDMYKIQ